MAERAFLRGPSPGFVAQTPPAFPSGRTLGPQGSAPPFRPPPTAQTPPPGVGRRPAVSAPGVPPVFFPGTGPAVSEEIEDELNREFVRRLIQGGLLAPFPLSGAAKEAGKTVARETLKRQVRKRARQPVAAGGARADDVRRLLAGAAVGAGGVGGKLVAVGPRITRTSAEITRAAARKRLAAIGISGALAGVLLSGSRPFPTEIQVTPKLRSVDLAKVAREAAAKKPSSGTSTTTGTTGRPKVTIGTIRKLFPWITAGVLATLFRPKIRVVTTGGVVRDAETLSDVPLPTNVAVPLLTGFPLTQTNPQRVGSDNCQIVQRRRRRKGRCREGFFRETARGTKYITWRSKKCR